jgi:hypothetical protein
VTIAELGSLGELVSGVAVLVTLIYLAHQVRQAKREAMIAQAQIRQDSGQSMLLESTRPALGSLIAEVNAKTGHTYVFQQSLEKELGLNHEQAYRLGQFCYVLMRYFETYLALESSPSARFRRNVKVNIAQPFVRVWWQDGRSAFQPRTIALIDELIREIEEEAEDGPTSPASA